MIALALNDIMCSMTRVHIVDLSLVPCVLPLSYDVASLLICVEFYVAYLHLILRSLFASVLPTLFASNSTRLIFISFVISGLISFADTFQAVQ